MKTTNKRKIINDPVHGFISIPDELSYDIINHPFFQRLRRIKQLGLTSLVYPGAVHTRFHHALGALHLMDMALNTLISKGVEISPEESQAAMLAILLHDIGHGPFSHALERSIVQDMDHEDLTLLFIERLNSEFNNQLEETKKVFNNTHSKPFLHQLVSGQLDVDRLDYLSRDSFYTGVSEGIIGTERIIKMLNVSQGELAVEIKGIYSIEKFIISRRLMYWQVYFHKTAVAAEQLLVKILERASYLAKNGEKLNNDDILYEFLKNSYNLESFNNDFELLSKFATLDDNDIMYCIKQWCWHSDKILSMLSNMLIHRNLFKIEMSDTPFDEEYIENKREEFINKLNINKKDISYFVFGKSISNKGYTSEDEDIKILTQKQELKVVTEISQQLNFIKSKEYSTKYYLCFPKY